MPLSALLLIIAIDIIYIIRIIATYCQLWIYVTGIKFSIGKIIHKNIFIYNSPYDDKIQELR